MRCNRRFWQFVNWRRIKIYPFISLFNFFILRASNLCVPFYWSYFKVVMFMKQTNKRIPFKVVCCYVFEINFVYWSTCLIEKKWINDTSNCLAYLWRSIPQKWIGCAFTFTYTVKLGYNELGYNEDPVITNKVYPPGWLRLFKGKFSRL